MGFHPGDGDGNVIDGDQGQADESDLIFGYAGDDTLSGLGGVDTLDGGLDDDLLFGGNGDDKLFGSDGADTLHGGDGNDFLDGDPYLVSDADVLTGGDGFDTLVGGDGGDSLDGGADADRLSGGWGDDTLIGGSGADVFAFERAFFAGQADVVGDFTIADGDRIDLSVLGISEFATVLELLSDAGDDVSLTSYLNGLAQSVTLAGISGLSALTSSTFILSDLVGDEAFNGGDSRGDLFGGLGHDTLHGGASKDRLFGEAGDDILDSRGSDDLVFAGGGLDFAQAGDGNDSVDGGEGDDTLDGGTGADSLNGGAGDDMLLVDDAGDVVTEGVDGGADLVQSVLSHSLAINIENLTLLGAANINGTGNGHANIITGNDGDNFLNGGGLADILSGGGGNDTMAADVLGDVLTEEPGEGIDTVMASVSYALGEELERLTLTGAGNIGGGGNGGANSISGNNGNNSLSGAGASDTLAGGFGNDTLDGGAAADSMSGGFGNDLLIVDDAGDAAVDGAGAGNDTVQTAIGFTLTMHVENLTLTGSASINGIGNTLANVITGNHGNNFLNGGTHADTLIGGAGNDTVAIDNPGDVIVEAADGGIDTVQSSLSHSLGVEFENLMLSGTRAINGAGNLKDNVIAGNPGNNNLLGSSGNDALHGGLGNDTLNGGAGNDSMVGSAGDEMFHVNDAGDVVIEHLNQGTDTAVSSVSHALAANVENLTLTGPAPLSGTGNGLDNIMTGNGSGNTLQGGAGKDTLSGGAGNDLIRGGAGGDTLTGGDGAEIFDFNSTADSAPVATMQDVVADFAADDLDKIDLSTIDAIAGGGSDAFTFIGQAAFTALGQLRYVHDGGSTFVEANTAGSNEPDMVIRLIGEIVLSAADFLA